MPYINIREQDVYSVSSFDTVENAVLIFGPDFHLYELQEPIAYDGGGNAVYKDNKSAYTYKLYTSPVDFVRDIGLGNYKFLPTYSDVYRPYVTAYDCLIKGLPVMYVPIDDYINEDYYINVHHYEQWYIDEDSKEYKEAIHILQYEDKVNETWTVAADSEGNPIDAEGTIISPDDPNAKSKYIKVTRNSEGKWIDDNGTEYDNACDVIVEVSVIVPADFDIAAKNGQAIGKDGTYQSLSDPPKKEELDNCITVILQQLKKLSGRYIEYNFLGIDKDLIPNPEGMEQNDYNNSLWSFRIPWNMKDDAIDAYKDYYESNPKNAMKDALKDLLEAALKDEIDLPLGDRINMPITFITTCGYEDYSPDFSDYNFQSQIGTLISNSTLDGTAGGTRLDLVYLYDLPTEVKRAGTSEGQEYYEALTPEKISDTTQNYVIGSLAPGEIFNIVYPWGTYTSYRDGGLIHMPGSYGYLMAYSSSVKNNAAWLAAAGVNRGSIPNIVNVDYKIRESYIHLWQGDTINNSVWDKGIRINPIVDLGSTYGKVVFGNRTCYDDVPETAIAFKRYLNIRILLLKIHKQAFLASLTHLFEPNDDLVWLSFKQKANILLDEMVSGRGLKWYKWKKIRTDKLGQIKAQLTIRPIEAVESFDILISMTDSDIEVQEG